GGERLWLAQIEGMRRPQLTVLELDRQGRTQARRSLNTWELEPGTPISLDTSRNQLLLALRPLGRPGARPPAPELMLLAGPDLALTPVGQRGRLALWLPP
ncbi:MAG: hypothetical protein VKM92_02330, partial [Cyanobacteriota bacterium]|nr:hypothetical protein [Cyanobacteriota bacterium]